MTAIAPPVVIDYGDRLNALIADLEPITAHAAQIGVEIAVGEIPGGDIILDFLGTQTISQFVAQEAASLETLLKGRSLSISPRNAVEAAVLGAINSQLPKVAAFFGAKLPPMVSAAVTKVLSTLPIPPPTEAPAKWPGAPNAI